MLCSAGQVLLFKTALSLFCWMGLKNIQCWEIETGNLFFCSRIWDGIKTKKHLQSYYWNQDWEKICISPVIKTGMIPDSVNGPVLGMTTMMPSMNPLILLPGTRGHSHRKFKVSHRKSYSTIAPNYLRVFDRK